MRAIASSAVSIAVVKGAPVASRVVVLLAIARLAAPHDLALASYAIAISEALKMFGDTGIDTWAVRALGRASAGYDGSRLTSAVTLVKILFGLAGGIVAAAITHWTGHAGAVLVLASGLLVLAGETFGAGVIYYLSLDAPAKLLPVSLFSMAFIPALATGLLLHGIDASWACASVAFAECLVAAYVLASLRRSRIVAVHPGILSEARDVARQSLPTSAYSAVLAVYLRLDAFALISFSASAYAAYALAFRAIQPFSFAFGAISLAFYSAQVRGGGRHALAPGRQMMWIIGTLFTLASAAAIVTYAFCAWAIANFVPAYADSRGALQLLCVLLPVAAVNNITYYVLAGDGRFKAILGVVSLGLVSEAILLWWLVPSMGARGAALSLLLSMVIGCAVLFWLISRPRPLREASRVAG